MSENGQIEVVVVVSNQDFSVSVDPNTNRIVGEPFSTNLTEENAFIAENLDTVSPVVRNENFLRVVYDHAVRKLEMLGATKLVQNGAHLIKDYNPHHLHMKGKRQDKKEN